MTKSTSDIHFKIQWALKLFSLYVLDPLKFSLRAKCWHRMILILNGFHVLILPSFVKPQLSRLPKKMEGRYFCLMDNGHHIQSEHFQAIFLCYVFIMIFVYLSHCVHILKAIKRGKRKLRNGLSWANAMKSTRSVGNQSFTRNQIFFGEW